jgi:hypothetical protein
MLEQLGSSVIFYAFYTEDGAGDAGLTVTVDVWEVTRAGTATEIVTGGTVTEVGDGIYRYLLAAGSVDAEAEYIAVFKTADGDTDQQHIPAMWVINRANVEDIDDILTDTATTIPDAISALNDVSTSDILGATVEGTYSVVEVLRIMVGVLAGKLSGGGTTELTFRDLSDTLDRAIVTVDSSANRTSVTINES